MVFDPEDTPAAHDLPLFDATLRSTPDDFRVDELMSVEPSGVGEHLWLRLAKTQLETADVIALLQRLYEVGSADIGVAGLKDRRAVTSQWFSIRTPETVDRVMEEMSAYTATQRLELLQHVRHGRKLRRGAHEGNAFTIVLRGVRAPDVIGLQAALDERVASLKGSGFPNYLGPQRFGRDGRNVERALAWFRNPSKRISRTRRGLWLSSTRSALYNKVLAHRVHDGTWNRLLEGEPAMLDGTKSFFLPDASEAAECGSRSRVGAASRADTESPADNVAKLDARLAVGDIHTSGPWWGRGAALSRGECLVLETAVLAGTDVLKEGLERAGLDQSRRALRAFPQALTARVGDDDTVTLTFTLSPGVFATTLLSEVGRCTLPTHEPD